LYKKVISAAALLAMSISSAAFAQPNVTQIQAQATVDNSCAFSTEATGQANNGFNFGDLTTASTATVSETASLTYVCNANNALNSGNAIGLALSDVNGQHNSNIYRLMNSSASSNNTIDFNIVQTGGSTEFVNSNVDFQNVTTAPVISLTATTATPLTTLAAGVYTDVITATLNS
jgi:hypothetical protein